jgi:hypothetical protein
VLVGAELLGAGAEEALLETGDDLVLTGELGLEVVIFSLDAADLFLKFVEGIPRAWRFRGGVFSGLIF